MKKRFILFMILFYSIIITPAAYSLDDDILKKNDGFMIVFWDSDSGDIEEIKDLTYPQFIEKIKPLDIVTDGYILKYYWNEQLLEIAQKRYRDDTGTWNIGSSSSFFTIVLNKKIIYYGISRTIQPSFKQKYDDSDYPAITRFSKLSEDTTILALTPKFSPFNTLKDFDEKEQKRILNKEVLKYFEKKGKIFRGKKDLNEILGYEYE